MGARKPRPLDAKGDREQAPVWQIVLVSLLVASPVIAATILFGGQS